MLRHRLWQKLKCGGAMRYYFNVFMTGREITDPEGTEMECIEDVQVEALATAYELLREYPEKIDQSALLEVVSDEGMRVFAVALKSAAVLKETPCEIRGCAEPSRWALPS